MISAVNSRQFCSKIELQYFPAHVDQYRPGEPENEVQIDLETIFHLATLNEHNEVFNDFLPLLTAFWAFSGLFIVQNHCRMIVNVVKTVS